MVKSFFVRVKTVGLGKDHSYQIIWTAGTESHKQRPVKDDRDYII